MNRVLFACLFLFGFVQVQSQVRFFAESDAKQVVLNGYFTVTYTLENANGKDFVPPRFTDFDVLSGPNQSSQMRIINGRTNQKISYSYNLSPPRTGTFRIQPAEIKAGNKTYRSNELEIEVLDAATDADKDSGLEDSFVEVELTAETGFIGQQISLKYVLYTIKDVRSYNFLKLPDFDGFFAQEIQTNNERPERIVRDGKQYIKRILKVVSLFPQQKGTFSIGPAIVNIGIARRGQRTSFFFNSNLQAQRITTSGAQIKIIDLPPNPPISFSGGVGEFFLGTSVDKRSITIDDAITLTIQVRGNGDSKFLEAPTQPLSAYFDIYDPNLLKQDISTVDDYIQTIKTYEYLMIPKNPGVITFNPQLTYYNTDSNMYVTLIGNSYTVNVLTTTARDVATFEQETELPPLYATYSERDKKVKILESKAFWACNGSLSMAFLLLLATKGYRIREEKKDPEEKRRNKAQKIALKRLELANQRLLEKNVKMFYVDLRKGILEYLSDKLGLPSAQLSKEKITNVMEANGLSNYIVPTIELLTKGEQAIYASVMPGKEEEDFDRAVWIIEEMERTLG